MQGSVHLPTSERYTSKDQGDPPPYKNQRPGSLLPRLWGTGSSARLACPTPTLHVCTHSQDGAVPLHEVSQLVQQPASAQGIQPAPRRAPQEGGLSGLHGFVHVGLSGQNNRESVSPFDETAVWDSSPVTYRDSQRSASVT